MFTGIVQAVGKVTGVAPAPRAGTDAQRLNVDLGALVKPAPVVGALVKSEPGAVARAAPALGASIAVNGVCLTVAELNGAVAGFDVVPETWRRTALPSLRAGDNVHLEPALKVGDALDGHFVQGHVDGVGAVERIERGAGEWKLWVGAPPELMRYIVPKGSIALDGTSLTVVDAREAHFSVALVPTTLERTTFARRRPGDQVNIETDILARLVLTRLEALLGRRSGEAPGGITWAQLQAGGYVV